MRNQTSKSPRPDYSNKRILRVRVVGLTLCFFWFLVSVRATGQQGAVPYIPAAAAFNDSPVCDSTDLSSDDDEARGRPEWKTIMLDPILPVLSQPPTILEGTVPGLSVAFPFGEHSGDQAPAEVSEEEIPWNHFTHDFTFKVSPDPKYQYLMSSYANPTNDSCPDGSNFDVCHHIDMEVEWENASLMDENHFQRTWGAIPEFVWPAVNDRVWVSGRWVFDCGHPSAPDGQMAHVKFSTEIHPPRALVTLRLNHPALDSFPVARSSAPSFAGPQSYLPVTGQPVTLPAGVPNSGPTNVPVTEADIFVSGNGGAANDLCHLTHDPGDDCGTPHTSPVILVNDRNYVFDIYPPGTDYNTILSRGTFKVTPPVPDASLQWRTVYHDSELPAHTCGGAGTSGCITVEPTLCLLDASTAPPDQSETACPQTVPDRPTRLRVILPFCGTDLSACNSNANYFARSILLGWDDVPSGSPVIISANAVVPSALGGAGGGPVLTQSPVVRTFRVTLHAFTVEQNGENCFNPITCPGDWRVFVSVGGQWRYMDPLFDGFPDNNACNGNSLTSNGDGDCFLFDRSPWIVSVLDGTPIHVSVGGWESDRIDSHFCEKYNDPSQTPDGCAPFSVGDVFALATANNDRIGTYEFDLQPPDYQWAAAPSFTTAQAACHHNLFDLNSINPLTCDELNYKVEFRVQELPGPSSPGSGPLGVGSPSFGQFVTSGTPLTLTSGSPDAEGFQYRSYLQSGPLPTYPSTQPFPVYWTHADLPAGSLSVPVFLSGADGPSYLQYSAQSFGQSLEPRHTAVLTLDNTPPVATIAQPAPTQYGHSTPLMLDYSVSDGSGSGVKNVTPKLDGQTAAQLGASLVSGQTIYLYSMALGTHTFSVDSVDNVNNAGTSSVVFTVAVTPDSLKEDVNDLSALSCIDNLSQSLIAKINAAQNLISKGQTRAAVNTLAALIQEVQAQAGKHISTTCKDPNGRLFDPVQLLLEDARYLQVSVAGQLAANPILGWVVNSGGAGIAGVTVNLMNSSGTVIGTAATDATGFYYFADTTTNGLTSGANCSLNVTIPNGYSSSTPASQTLTWSAKSVVEDFMLN